MFVIGTAGHIDHGKSLLVEALTGIDPDRLREEKARGMTIDLGFAWLTLPSGRTVSIIDVPGHERFIKNMLAGAGGIDLALLVVAADDGVMPQTREHLAILDLLGVTSGVVALTKIDLVDRDWASLAEAEITDTLLGTMLEGSVVVPCSSLTGAGLDDLRHALDAAAANLPPKRDIGRPRLPVDRVFTVGGFGTVVTGTLVDGSLTTGSELEALPGSLRGRIRGLQTHKDSVERTLPGTRTAVNLSGIARDQLRRGIVLALPGTLLATDVVDARVRAVCGLVRPLRHNMHLTFHCLADEAPAVLRLLDADELRAGDQAWAQIKLAVPVACARDDHFVLRTADDTVAGGLIVHTAPRRHRRHHAPTVASLERRLSGTPEDVVLEAIARSPLALRDALVQGVALAEADASVAIASLVARGDIVALGDGTRFATRTFWEETRRRIHDELAAYHAAQPLRPGMPLEEMRSQHRLDPPAFSTLLEGMPEIAVRGALVALAGHEPAPSDEQQRQADALIRALQAAPYHPPPPDGVDPALLAYLVASGRVVDAGDGVVFDAGSFDEMQGAVRRHIVEHGSIKLSAARDLFGTSRRYAQALLEHLDRLRVTRRDGDDRYLR